MSAKLTITWKEGENLNKDNFWDAAHVLLPEATKRFCEWIDEYKKIQFPSADHQIAKFNWDMFFGNLITGHYQIKFHHIPFEMQIGIIFRFLNENLPERYCAIEMGIFEPGTIVTMIVEAFVILENKKAPKDVMDDLLEFNKNNPEILREGSIIMDPNDNQAVDFFKTILPPEQNDNNGQNPG